MPRQEACASEQQQDERAEEMTRLLETVESQK